MATALPTVFLNGSYLPKQEAQISPFDRGFLFADAVYEVIPVFGDKPLLLTNHLLRLDNSLQELQITNPHNHSEWAEIISELVSRNGGGDLAVYLQVSRGAEDGRDHFYPAGITPTVFAMVTAIQPSEKDTSGISAITLDDTRWLRCDIKSTALLANIMVRQHAVDSGADDAILIRDGMLTEGGSASVIFVKDETIITRPNGNELLPGTTRAMVLDLAKQDGFNCIAEVTPLERLRSADEIWLLSATKGVVPVITLDGQKVGTGKPGKVWQRIHQLYEAAKRS